MQEEDELDLSDIEGLDPHIAELIQQKARDKAAQNRKHARAALNTYDGLFRSMYRSLANFTNFTSDSVWIYLRLFSVTDNNQRRLVRNKMSLIFKPNIRRSLNTNVSDTTQGIFGGTTNVMKNIEDNKKINMLVKQSLLQTKKTGKVAKASKNKGKKPAAEGSKTKGKKGSKKKAVSNKTKAKGSSGDDKEKEDSSKEKKKD